MVHLLEMKALTVPGLELEGGYNLVTWGIENFQVMVLKATILVLGAMQLVVVTGAMQLVVVTGTMQLVVVTGTMLLGVV